MGKHAVIFINLGTPKSPEVGDVRSYLREFLSDPLVIDIPSIPRWLLVNGIIAPFRSRRSSKAYKSVWTKQGSPLMVFSEQFTERINRNFQGTDTEAFLTMRYGEPSMEKVFQQVGQGNFDKVTLFPLYPQYALSTTQTVLNKAKGLLHHLHPSEVNWVQPFYNEEYFLKPYGEIIQRHLNQETFDHILYSYHGLPKRHISKIPGCEGCEFTDECCRQPGERLNQCYRAQCVSTTEGLIKYSGMNNLPYDITFQSRLGGGWLEPFTDVRLEELAEKGVKKLAVVCPAFVVDCLETLEEIELEGQNEFVKRGGEKLKLIPCLNADDAWADQLSQVILQGKLNQMRIPTRAPTKSA